MHIQHSITKTHNPVTTQEPTSVLDTPPPSPSNQEEAQEPIHSVPVSIPLPVDSDDELLVEKESTVIFLFCTGENMFLPAREQRLILRLLATSITKTRLTSQYSIRHFRFSKRPELLYSGIPVCRIL